MKTIIIAILIAITTPAAAVPWTMTRGVEVYTGFYNPSVTPPPNSLHDWRATTGAEITLWNGIVLAEGNIFGRSNFLRVNGAGMLTVFDTVAGFQGLATIFAFEDDNTYTTDQGDTGRYWFGALAVPAPGGALMLAVGILFIRRNRNEH